jgi:nicotinamide-nucleotide amidase
MTTKKVAILATGDEIVNGDILNTNAQAIAQMLFSHQMTPGMCLSTTDRQTDLETGMAFLLKHHDAMITIGGLGPTSDDCTRFALANVVEKPLTFHEPAWESIQARFKQLNFKNLPDSNRQQALFPETADVIHNENGSAAACCVYHQNKPIFMLPGPPKECLPLFEKHVLLRLKNTGFTHHKIFKHWLLFGVSEGMVSEKLDKWAEPFAIKTGYRVDYPYLEFKIIAEDNQSVQSFLAQAGDFIQQHQINPQNQRASSLLKQHLETHDLHLSITDRATKGDFAHQLISPSTHEKIHTEENAPEHCLSVTIEGLEGFWQTNPEKQLSFTINKETIMLTNLNNRALLFINEKVAQTILNLIDKDQP